MTLPTARSDDPYFEAPKGSIGIHSLPPLDPVLYRPTSQARAFLKEQLGLQDDEALKQHIMVVQKKAYSIAPYPCIRTFTFTEIDIIANPAYKELLKIGRERKDAIFLEMGSCFGQEARKAVADGFPAAQVVLSDIKGEQLPELMEMGHELFKTSAATFPAHIVSGDALDPNMLEVNTPIYDVPDMPYPDLSALGSLNPLRGHVSAIYASKFFHLFDEAKQTHLARALGGLLSPEPGSVIFGAHISAKEKGPRAITMLNTTVSVFCHSPESWTELWDGNVYKKGTVRVDASIQWFETMDGSVESLKWAVTRL
ncbi:hypothetical protein CONPUDRAFT_146773 [Coniophora puteana RWD-64-598 SS2]|uniref:Uncharacterized protein n=1 Tax=Coniophora puteana (strain RWD-64-598) TaxID=741705 RepID=A0A5M3MB51_CONPW|nr:uncharacterized protein CONPUDRAFT_146773 [Coniophora puteana RWD-64-598 SS2]EIW76287.1 hypothetical protein CONPUDRAFT_146773 [Coniophora puteana RWD-64-598 SS2]